MSGNSKTCPFCNSVRASKTHQVAVEGIIKRAEANDAGAMHVLAGYYYHGRGGLQLDQTKSMELYARAAELGFSKAHFSLGSTYEGWGNLKKAKFYFEAAAMAGHEMARFNLGCIDAQSGNIERALKHWAIAASGGQYLAMHNMLAAFEKGYISKESIDSTLAAYNDCCAEMRSETRDAYIHTCV
jgi:TPR repeat protein